MKEIKEKINYCLNCKIKPCRNKGCPLGNDIPGFIQAMKEENYEEAYKILIQTTVLSGVCGRICPHFKQCQSACIRGIKGEPVSIGELEALVFDKVQGKGLQTYYNNKNNLNKKVAVIGGGPAGLTCSAFLAKAGIEVTIYEKYNYLGGLLIHGIPDFRLPKEIVKQTIDEILSLGIKVKYNQELGRNITLAELEKEYDAIFLGIGANVSSKMGTEGEELSGVFGGNELLEYKQHPDYKGKTVSVFGGGNVAMDCARTIKRLGAEKVNIIYRRAREQMPAETKEIEEAENEGIKFLFCNNLVRINGNKKVEEIELIKTELVAKEGENRLVPVNVEGSNYKIKTDYVVMALGSKPENLTRKIDLETNERGYIKVDDRYQTSNKKVYAGGDVAGMKSTVAWAALSGREAAKNIIEELNK